MKAGIIFLDNEVKLSYFSSFDVDNYENIIKSLKEKFESLEESSVKQIGEY